MSDNKVDLTEKEWKEQLHSAYLSGASKEREVIVEWLKEGASRDYPDDYETTSGWLLAILIDRGAHFEGFDE